MEDGESQNSLDFVNLKQQVPEEKFMLLESLALFQANEELKAHSCKQLSFNARS